MSINASEITCSKCSSTFFVTHAPILLIYNFKDVTFETGRKFGWCFNCEKITDIEPKFDSKSLLYQIDEIELELTNTKKSLFGLFSKNLSNKIELLENIEQLSKELEFSKLRQSPQKCLNCGSTHLNEIDLNKEKIITHNCGGYLYRLPENNDSPRFMFKMKNIYLNLEGEIINPQQNSAEEVVGRKISPKNEDATIDDIYQQIVDTENIYFGYFRQSEFYEQRQSSDLEISLFLLAVLSYVFLRFTNVDNKENKLDKLTRIFLQDLIHLYEECTFEELLTQYRAAFAEYFGLINLLFEENQSSSGNPSITLAMHLFERVTKVSSRTHMMSVVGLSKILTEYIADQVKFAKAL